VAQIVINDLPENADLDDAAMRTILGGQRLANPGSQRTQSLIVDRLMRPVGTLLPQIGLGSGYLGSRKLR
jgi:hypothetical protein